MSTQAYRIAERINDYVQFCGEAACAETPAHATPEGLNVSAPLSRGVLVSANAGRLEQDPLGVDVLQVLEDTRPETLLSPPLKATEDRVPLALLFGQFTPGRSYAVNPQDYAREPAGVEGGNAAVGRLAL